MDDYFSELSEEQMRHFVAATVYQQFPVGSTLALQGQPGDNAFLILEGEVEITLTHNAISRKIGVRTAGHIVGEMALLDDQPRSATLTALTEVRVLKLGRSAFEHLLTTQPELSLAVNRSLSARMRVTLDSLVQDLMLEIERLETELAECRRQLAVHQSP